MSDPVTEWGIRLDDGSVVTDSDWRCAADVMASTHGFSSSGPYAVVVREAGEDSWADFW